MTEGEKKKDAQKLKKIYFIVLIKSARQQRWGKKEKEKNQKKLQNKSKYRNSKCFS